MCTVAVRTRSLTPIADFDRRKLARKVQNFEKKQDKPNKKGQRSSRIFSAEFFPHREKRKRYTGLREPFSSRRLFSKPSPESPRPEKSKKSRSTRERSESLDPRPVKQSANSRGNVNGSSRLSALEFEFDKPKENHKKFSDPEAKVSRFAAEDLVLRRTVAPPSIDVGGGGHSRRVVIERKRKKVSRSKSRERRKHRHKSKRKRRKKRSSSFSLSRSRSRHKEPRKKHSTKKRSISRIRKRSRARGRRKSISRLRSRDRKRSKSRERTKSKSRGRHRSPSKERRGKSRRKKARKKVDRERTRRSLSSKRRSKHESVRWIKAEKLGMEELKIKDQGDIALSFPIVSSSSKKKKKKSRRKVIITKSKKGKAKKDKAITLSTLSISIPSLGVPAFEDLKIPKPIRKVTKPKAGSGLGVTVRVAPQDASGALSQPQFTTGGQLTNQLLKSDLNITRPTNMYHYLSPPKHSQGDTSSGKSVTLSEQYLKQKHQVEPLVTLNNSHQVVLRDSTQEGNEAHRQRTLPSLVYPAHGLPQMHPSRANQFIQTNLQSRMRSDHDAEQYKQTRSGRISLHQHSEYGKPNLRSSNNVESASLNSPQHYQQKGRAMYSDRIEDSLRSYHHDSYRQRGDNRDRDHWRKQRDRGEKNDLERPRKRRGTKRQRPVMKVVEDEPSLSEYPLHIVARDSTFRGKQGQRWNMTIEDARLRSFAAYLPNTFDEQTLWEWFKTTEENAPWQQPTVRGHVLPRKAGWFVEPGCGCKYKYSGTKWDPTPFPGWFMEITSEVMKRLCIPLDKLPNSCNVNLYYSGSASVGWHTDNEPIFESKIRDCLIISLSLGVSRKFQVKRNDSDKILKDVMLGNGDLMTMEGLFQKHFLHRVPKMPHVVGKRINFTWRWVTAHVRSECTLGRGWGLGHFFGKNSRWEQEKPNREVQETINNDYWSRQRVQLNDGFRDREERKHKKRRLTLNRWKPTERESPNSRRKGSFSFRLRESSEERSTDLSIKKARGKRSKAKKSRFLRIDKSRD